MTGPVAHSVGNLLRPVPLSAVELGSTGWWGGWQQLNAETTLPYGLGALETAGNIDNFRRVVGDSDAPYRGFVFNDSDLYKTLEAVAWTLANRPGAFKLEAYVKSATELLGRVQAADGYLNTYVQGEPARERFVDLAESHELYCAGHLFQAAVAHYRVTASRELLDIAVRVADQLVGEFGSGRRSDYDGHPEVETALVELFRATGDGSYLRLSQQFLADRGAQIFGHDRRGHAYFQDELPIREAATIVGHSVRALYLEAGVVDVAVETGDAELLASSVTRWQDMVGSKLYLTGGLGSRHKSEGFGDPYELPPDRAYCETCAAIASIHWNWRLLLATGQGRYADLLERTVYNGFAAGLGLDGTSFFYSNPLQVRANHHAGDEEESGRRLAWYSCACCPPNIMRLLASLQHYVATTDDGGVQLHQYTDVVLDLRSGGRDVVLSVSTRYPWDGHIAVSVVEGAPAAWQLSLRVPGWAAWLRVTVNGQHADAEVVDGYVRISRDWAAGDVVVLDLDLTPRFTVANANVDAVRGCVAIERGPLVYCVEGVDNPDLDLAAVLLDPGTPLQVAEIPGWPGIVGLRVAAFLQSSEPDVPLYAGAGSAPATDSSTSVTAIPYYLWANRAHGPMRVWLPSWSARPSA